MNVAPKYPQQIGLEVANICNQTCPICPCFNEPAPMDRSARKPQTMSFDLFTSLAEQIASWPAWSGNIFLNMFGEPLMDKGLAPKMALLETLGLAGRVHLQTNASLLDTEVASMLLEHKLGRLIPCMDSLCSTTFETIRRGAHFDAIRDNIVNFIKLRNSTHSQTGISLQYVRTKINMEDFHDVYTFFKPLLGNNDALWITTSHSWAAPSLYDSGLIIAQPCRTRVRATCDSLTSSLIVLADGVVPTCCFDYNLENPALGRADQESLLNIWNGPQLNAIRDSMEGSDEHLLPLCRHCTTLYSNYDVDNKNLFMFPSDVVTEGHHGAVISFNNEMRHE